MTDISLIDKSGKSLVRLLSRSYVHHSNNDIDFHLDQISGRYRFVARQKTFVFFAADFVAILFVVVLGTGAGAGARARVFIDRYSYRATVSGSVARKNQN